jgi:AraC-like DNA-binding protein
MISFSTDDLRPQDRFDHWCEVRGKHLFGCTIELDRERRPDFYGRFSAFTVGGAVMAEMSASSYRVSRTAADIARVSGDSLCIGLQVRGPGQMDTGRGGVHAVREGSFTVSHSDLPFAGTPDRSDGFLFRTLKIPLTSDLVLDAPVHDLSPAPLLQGVRLTRLIGAMFNALSVPSSQTPGEAAADIRHIARLAMMARGRLGLGFPGSRAALHAGYRYAARAILDRDFHRPQMSAASVAHELGISLRQLHLLFEPTGLSFARTLTMRRLEAARRLIETAQLRSVAEVGYACGFDSMATFYRVFRSAYGMTPGDVRALAAGRESL